MRIMKTLVWLVLVVSLSGCVSSNTLRGAAIGALAGAAGGATVGVLVSDEDLLGTTASTETGDVTISPAQGIGVGVLVGAVFGGIIGAIAGHAKDDRYTDIQLEEEPSVLEELPAEEAADADAEASVRPGPELF
jgi:hypothetical protein